jgi:hypothetical protein
MAISVGCGGWGVQSWGLDPWGSGVGTGTPPAIISVSPGCGSTGVPNNVPIVIKVCGSGCGLLAGALVGTTADCIQIKMNGTLIYDGTGLTSATLDNGFLAPCNQACSAVVVDVTPASGATAATVCYTFTICCTTFNCSSTNTIEATFCDAYGNSIDVTGCTFKTTPCNLISDIEIIDSRHVVVRFINRLLPNPNRNKALYEPTSWKLLPVGGGFIDGIPAVVKNVLVEKSYIPKTVILETTTITTGAMYELVPSPDILDIHRQPLQSGGAGSLLLGRKTKVDHIVSRLPTMYKMGINSSTEEDNNVIALWQILAAIGVEDERGGGDY